MYAERNFFLKQSEISNFYSHNPYIFIKPMKTMKAILTKKETGKEQIRLDLAWKLFFPGNIGKHPHYSDLLYPFTNWLWIVLGNQSGFMRQEQNVTKTFKINDMEESSLVFLIRILSM